MALGVGRTAAGGRGHGGLARSCPRPRDLEGRSGALQGGRDRSVPRAVRGITPRDRTPHGCPRQAPRCIPQAPPRAAPRDFWMNLRLGMLLLKVGGPAEAVG